MKKEKIATPKANLIASIALISLYSITFLIDFFTQKKITTTSLIMAVGALIVFFLFLRKIDKMYYLGLMTFVTFAQYFGAMLNFYAIIPIYDLLLHLVSGFLLVFAGHFVYQLLIKNSPKANIPLQITVLFCTAVSIASAALWEIWEFSGDVLLKLTSQGTGVADTMTDIIAGTIGAIIGGICLFFILKKRIKKIVLPKR